MALGVFATNLKASQKTTTAGRYLRDFKPVLNTRYRVFLPQFQYDDEDGTHDQVATITVAARQFSYKELGVFSYVFDENEILIADDGSFTDLTQLLSLERMASVLHQAEFTAEVAAAEKAAREEAEEAGVKLDQEALGLQREQIEKKYFRGKDQNNDPTKKPLIGPALKYTYTIGVFVPMTSAGTPDYEKAQVAIWTLSGARQQKILDLYKAEAYQFSGKPYFEFSFDYSGTTPKEAGQKATYEYIPENLSLATKYPTDWQKDGAKLMEQLPKGTVEEMANTIVAKCGNLHNRVSIADICSKFYAAVATKQTAVIAIKKLDKEYLKKNKRYIKDLPVLDKYPAIKEFVNEIEDGGDEEETAVAASTPAAEETVQAAPVEKQVTPDVNISGAEGAVTFGGLNPNPVGTADEEDMLGDI